MVVLRKFEHPTKEMSDYNLVRKFCISLGLLQPGDSRDIIVHILLLLLKSKQKLTPEQIAERLEGHGASASNVRRHLRRLLEIGLIKRYYVHEPLFLSVSEYLTKELVACRMRLKKCAEIIDSLLPDDGQSLS